MMWKTIVFYIFTAFLITPVALGRSIPQAPPSLSVSPGKALIDERVRVRVTGLRPRQDVTIKASMKDAGDRQWQSEASFLADRHGVVDCGRQAPISGSYKTVDPMGLFWSMAPVSALAQKGGPLFRRDTTGTGSVVMNFDLVIEGRTVASAKVLRLFAAPEVRVRDVREEGLIGRVYELPTAGRRPAILVLTGGAGGIQNRFAPLLASHGYTVFSLAYFGVDPLPRDLREIPLEYCARAIAWLRSRPSVDGNRVGILGGSKGGELALLLASTFPRKSYHSGGEDQRGGSAPVRQAGRFVAFLQDVRNGYWAAPKISPQVPLPAPLV
ncbi:MAG: acyl-CoA thioesterase/BAAT N-terminal domain-containing protein [Acidobacteria bacterium]|nr:acyl-CoA thioesterase/BAAT N-terminal domain-containing protein [Acidobacteriota bacterium]